MKKYINIFSVKDFSPKKKKSTFIIDFRNSVSGHEKVGGIRLISLYNNYKGWTQYIKQLLGGTGQQTIQGYNSQENGNTWVESHVCFTFSPEVIFQFLA